MMTLTEAEAKTKWCPQARIIAGEVSLGGKVSFQGGQTAFNVAMDTDNGNRSYMGVCAGSACMMWRWHEPWTSSTEEGQGGDLVLRLSRKPGEPKRGFCGLAGAA
jgi:hypothetical protein